jgi:dienelactone hydrolase
MRERQHCVEGVNKVWMVSKGGTNRPSILKTQVRNRLPARTCRRAVTLGTSMIRREGVRRLSWLLAAGLVCLIQGCSYLSLLQNTYSGRAPAQRFHFRDGGEAIYFSFDKRLERESPSEAARPIDTYLFVVGGSDCTSMQYLLPQYFRGLEGESGPIRIFFLQKRFIEARTWGRAWGCGADFIRADHPSRWIADQTEFIAAQLAPVRAGPHPPKRIAVLGISEGGDIVPLLARHIPGVTHAAIVANGGMNPLDAYRLQAEKQGFTAALDALASLDQAPPADPDAAEHFIAGRTWRYWSELRALTHTDNLLALTIPILIGMGDADQLVPVESAWYIRDRFVQHGKINLSLLVYPGADHGLHSTERAYLADFWLALDKYLQK